MRLHFLGRAKKLLELLLLKTTNSQDQLSTIQQAFFKGTTVTKISQNAARHSMSISCNSIELAKPQQSQKSSQNATGGGGGGGGWFHFLE